MSIPDSRAFIRAQTRLLPVPHAPEISLHIADVATERGFLRGQQPDVTEEVS